MIPINSICLLTSGLFFALITLKIYLSYVKSKEEKVGNFYRSVLFLSLTQILASTPGFVFDDPVIIGWIFLVYPFFALMALAYFGTIPLQILGWNIAARAYFNTTVLLGLVITIVNTIRTRPAIVHYSGKFVYWQDGRGVVMNTVIGITLSTIMIALVGFYYYQGSKSEESYVRRRAFVVAAALLCLVIGAVVNFIIGSSPNIYLPSLISTFFFILSGIFLLISTFYKVAKR